MAVRLLIKETIEKILQQFVVTEYDHTKFTYSSNWTYYSTGDRVANAPRAIKCGRIVNLKGAYKNTTQMSTGLRGFGKVPAGCEPLEEQHVVQQGSGQNKFLLMILPDGTMQIDRYGVASNVVIPKDSWINITATYISSS